jgi:putative transcriptional regulator
MAIGLNRPMNGLRVPSLLRRLGVASAETPDVPVMLGGPCGRDRGYVLHTEDYWSPASTLKVAPGVGLTDTREVLDALGDRARRPRRFLLALGYAGWTAGQLEQEIRDGVWLSCEPDEALLFGEDHEEKWTRALGKIGVRADQLSSQAGWA